MPAVSPNNIVADSIKYFGTNVIERILAFIRGTVVAYILGPAAYGIWNGLQLVLDYTAYGSLGLPSAMSREYTYYMGKNQQQDAEKIKDTAFTVGINNAILLCIFLIIAAFFLKTRHSAKVIAGLYVISIASVLQQIVLYYKELFRIEKRINKVNMAILIFSVINCLLSVFLVIKFGLYGLYAALIMAYIITMFYILDTTRHYFIFRIDFGRLKQLFVLGVSLSLIPFLSMILLTIDKIMIIKFLGATSLGYYSLSSLIMGLILYLPIALQFVSYPHLIEDYARTNSPKDSLLKFVLTPTLVIVYPIAFIIGVVLLTAHLPLKYFLPKFMPGLFTIKVLTIGTFFFSLVYLPVNFLVAINKQFKVLKIQALCVLLNVVLVYISIIKGRGINGVAFATGIAYFMFGNLMLGYTIRQYRKDLTFLIRFFAKAYLPLVYVMGVVLILDLLISVKAYTVMKDLLASFFKLLVFLIVTVPFLYHWNKRKDKFWL